MEASNRNSPLRVEINGGELCIRIGVETLAFAANHADSWNPFDADVSDFRQALEVVEPNEFARDVLNAMLDEAEDGSSPLTRLLDKMFDAAANDGSCGIDFDPKDKRSAFAKDFDNSTSGKRWPGRDPEPSNHGARPIAPK